MLTAGIARAIEYEVVYQQVIDGAEGYSSVYPLVTPTDQLAGFVNTKPLDSTLYILDLCGDSAVAVSLDYVPVQAIARYGVTTDTIFVYSISDADNIQGLPPPEFRIGLTTIVASEVTNYSIEPVICSDGYYMPILTSFLSKISFEPLWSLNPTKLVVYTSVGIEDHIVTMGVHYYSCKLITEYNLCLDTELSRVTADGLVHGLFSNASAAGSATKRQRSYIVMDDPWNSYTVHEARVQVRDYDGSTIILQSSENGGSRSLFAEDFLPSRPYDELISHGYLHDLLDLHADENVWHLACYSFVGGIPQEEWYVETSNELNMEYYFQRMNTLIGRCSDRWLKILDCASGEWVDSVQLDRSLNDIAYFESNGGEALNLLGRVHDTIFVYKFQTSTDIEDGPVGSSLPESFVLHQNYPNPFNNSCVIRLDNQVRQYVSLKIYSLLGRHVKTLVDRQLSAGSFSFTWDGLNYMRKQVASGLYLARLETTNESSSIKMLLIK